MLEINWAFSQVLSHVHGIEPTKHGVGVGVYGEE